MDKKKEAEFDSLEFEKRLLNLKDTQDSIQAMSAWCLKFKTSHKKIVTSWLGILKQVKVEQRLTLFYLANDVIQYSKRKNYDFVDSWGTALQRATTMVRDEKVKHKIERIFKIWEQRSIYNEEFLADLNGLLSINPAKKPQLNDNDDEQASVTIANIKNCVRLEKETDKSFKLLPRTPLYDTETLNILKDRRHVEEVEQQVNETRSKLEHYVKSLSAEIKARSILISVLDQSTSFYHNQRGEVKVVANAYRNFGNRIKAMKRKLEELTNSLPSPIPSPDANAPSPGPADNDFVLPGEKEFDPNMFGKQSNGFLGYMDGGNLPFDINDFGTMSPKSGEAQQIQVINSAGPKEDFNIDEFFKSIMPEVYNPADPQPQPVPSPANNYMNYQAHPEYVPPTGNIYNNQMPQYGNDHYNPNMPGGSMYSAGQMNSYNRPPLNNAYAPVPKPPPPFPPTNPNSYTPLPPPPPPTFDTETLNDEYNPDNWEMDMSWNTTQNSSFNQSLDGPRSPPHYERKGHNSNLIEYIDPSIDGNISGSGDVDHRQLMVPLSNILAKGGKGRPADVDHRNLISLTGSPKTDKDLRTLSGTSHQDNHDKSKYKKEWKKDKDVRQINAPASASSGNKHLDPADVFGLHKKSPRSMSVSESKLVPPPSPPALLLATSGLSDQQDIDKSPMNPPLLPPPRFQSPPSQRQKTTTKSPARSQNGRDNTEAIDMEMSDEDFDTLPEFLDSNENESFNTDDMSSNDPSEDRDHNSTHDRESQGSPMRPPPNLFATPPSAFGELDPRWDDNQNNSFNGPMHSNPFRARGAMSEPSKRSNPFSENPNPHEMMQMQQQQMGLPQHLDMSRRNLNSGFSNPRPFGGGNGAPRPDIDPFMMNSPRGPPQFMPQQPMNFRGGQRNNSPYFRTPKGGGGPPSGNMRGGFRPNFRGRNW